MTVRLLLTGGPTREHLDPIRFLSNASSGKQCVAIAEEAVSRGWAVDLVHGPLEVPPPAGVTAHPVTSADQMLLVCRRLHPSCDVLIGAAAVSDYRPSEPLDRKLKRSRDEWIVRLVPTVDILADLSSARAGRVHVGFALETENPVEAGREKLKRKGVDLLVVNNPREPGAAIGGDTNVVTLLEKGKPGRKLPVLPKRGVAERILDWVVKRRDSMPRRANRGRSSGRTGQAQR